MARFTLVLFPFGREHLWVTLERMNIFHVALMSQFTILLPKWQKEMGNQVTSYGYH